MKDDQILKRIMTMTLSITAIVFLLAAAKASAKEELKFTFASASDSFSIEDIPVLSETNERDADEDGLIRESISAVDEFDDKEADPDENTWDKYATSETETIETKTVSVYDFLFGEYSERIMNVSGENAIIIRKPDENAKLSISDDLLTRSLFVAIENSDDPGAISPEDIYRISGDKSLNGGWYEMSYDLVSDMKFKYRDGGNAADITITTKDYWLYKSFNIGEYYVISMQRPKDVYDKIVVIDAGHGGWDRGALALDNVTREADINLQAVTELKKILDEDPDIHVFYTRLDDSYPTLDERVELANGVGADLFISIHCNAFDKQNSNGTETLYNTKQGIGDKLNSEVLARIIVSNLVQTMGTRLRGIVSGDEIRIVRRSEVPVTLVELGFITNRNDYKVISDENKMKQIAESIYKSILTAYEILETEND